MTLRSVSLLMALVALAAAPRAQAEGADDPAGAKVLFDQAVELASAGNFPEACEKLEASRKAHDGLGTSFHLAGCWQKIGRTASAYALFESVATRAREAGQTERAELARSRMDALGPKLSRLRIDLAQRAAHTEVYRDDQPVPETEFGKPVPVDHGQHSIRVTAEGKAPWTSQVDVSEPSVIIVVAVPALANAPPPAIAAAAPKPEPKPEPEKKEEPASGKGARTRAIIIGGVGAAALTFGILEGAQYVYSNRAAEGICPSGLNCTDEEIAQHDKAVHDAKVARTWAFVGVGVGTATVALATYLFFSAPRGPAPADEKRTALAVEPLIDGRGTWGAALNGSF